MSTYPRDLVGHADRPPDPRWPGGARLAVNFVLDSEAVHLSLRDNVDALYREGTETPKTMTLLGLLASRPGPTGRRGAAASPTAPQ